MKHWFFAGLFMDLKGGSVIDLRLEVYICYIDFRAGKGQGMEVRESIKLAARGGVLLEFNPKGPF